MLGLGSPTFNLKPEFFLISLIYQNHGSCMPLVSNSSFFCIALLSYWLLAPLNNVGIPWVVQCCSLAISTIHMLRLTQLLTWNWQDNSYFKGRSNMDILVIQRFPARNNLIIVLVDVMVWLSVVVVANSQTCESWIQDVIQDLTRAHFYQK